MIISYDPPVKSEFAIQIANNNLSDYNNCEMNPVSELIYNQLSDYLRNDPLAEIGRFDDIIPLDQNKEDEKIKKIKKRRKIKHGIFIYGKYKDKLCYQYVRFFQFKDLDSSKSFKLDRVSIRNPEIDDQQIKFHADIVANFTFAIYKYYTGDSLSAIKFFKQINSKRLDGHLLKFYYYTYLGNTCIKTKNFHEAISYLDSALIFSINENQRNLVKRNIEIAKHGIKKKVTISGYISSREGKPIEGAEVIVNNEWVKTDNKGYYNIKVDSTNEYKFTIQCPNFMPITDVFRSSFDSIKLQQYRLEYETYK